MDGEHSARIISASRNEGVLRVWDVRQRKKTNLGRNEPPKIGELIVGKQRLPGVNALSYQVVKLSVYLCLAFRCPTLLLLPRFSCWSRGMEGASPEHARNPAVERCCTHITLKRVFA